MLDPTILRALGVLAVVLLAVLAGRLWQRRSERLVTGGQARLSSADLEAIGLHADARPAKAVLFSSPTCRPCRTVQDVLSEVEAKRPAFGWVSVDAGDHLDLTRRHRVMKVPTLLVMDRSGTVIARTSGVPDRDDLLALVDTVGRSRALPR